MGHDPQPPAEAHRVEVLQPFALPDPIAHMLGPDRAGRHAAARWRARRSPRAWRWSAANSAFSTVCGHSRSSPGAGSRIASSTASVSVTDSAPASKQAASAAAGSVPFEVDAQREIGGHGRDCGSGAISARAAAPGSGCRGRRCWNAVCARISWCSAVFVLMPSTTSSASALRMRAIAVCARVAVRDQLADHRVVVRRHGVAGVDVAVDADARAARRVPALDQARRGHEGARVLGVDAALDAHGRGTGCLPAGTAASRRRRSAAAS